MSKKLNIARKKIVSAKGSTSKGKTYKAGGSKGTNYKSATYKGSTSRKKSNVRSVRSARDNSTVTSHLRNFFFPKTTSAKSKTDFSTNFSLGNVAISAKSKKQNSKMKVDLNIESPEVTFTGNLLMSERKYIAFERMMNNMVSNVRKIAGN